MAVKHSGSERAIKESYWRTWRQAILDLPENPFAHYLALAEQRRVSKLPWYRRYMLVLLVATAGMLVHIWSSIIYLAYAQTAAQTAQSDVRIALMITASAMLGAMQGGAYGYLIQGIYRIALGGISLLGSTTSRQSYLELGELEKCTTISDIDILAGTLRHLVWPFWKCWAVFTVVATAAGIASTMIINPYDVTGLPKLDPILALTSGGLHGNEPVALLATVLPWNVWQAVIALVNLVPGFLSGLLASLGLMMMLICLGRGVQAHILGTVAAVLTTIAQLLSAYAMQMFTYMPSITSLATGYQKQAEVVPWEEEQLLLALMLAAIATCVAAVVMMLMAVRWQVD